MLPTPVFWPGESMDRTVHGVAKRWTPPSVFHSFASFSSAGGGARRLKVKMWLKPNPREDLEKTHNVLTGKADLLDFSGEDRVVSRMAGPSQTCLIRLISRGRWAARPALGTHTPHA